eukprot:1175944-Prorocentrum_minimum.AAC.5
MTYAIGGRHTEKSAPAENARVPLKKTDWFCTSAAREWANQVRDSMSEAANRVLRGLGESAP